MIKRIDLITIAVRDADAAADAYRRLLGREPAIQDGMGSRRVWFRFPNLALEVLGPFGEGVSGDRLRKRLETAGEGLWLLGFSVDDLDAAMRLLNRRGLPWGFVEATRPSAMGSAAGVAVTLVTPREDPMSASIVPEAAAVAALDHVVVRTPNPDRALGIYGAKLGLDLHLDRENAESGARQMLFRCGDVVVEIGANVSAPASDAPDRLDGLAWRVPDAKAARARMAAAGFDASEVRARPESGVLAFTIRDAPAGVPTVIIEAKRSAGNLM